MPKNTFRKRARMHLRQAYYAARAALSWDAEVDNAASTNWRPKASMKKRIRAANLLIDVAECLLSDLKDDDPSLLHNMRFVTIHYKLRKRRMK